MTNNPQEIVRLVSAGFARVFVEFSTARRLGGDSVCAMICQ